MHYDTDTKVVYKDRPDWFSYESCLVNLLSTISSGPKDVYVKFHLIFDGSEDSFNNNFCSNYLPIEEKKISENLTCKTILINAGSGSRSSQLTLDYISEQSYKNNELVYILENDYLHTQCWIENVRDIYQSGISFDYLSLYDHGDKYQHNIGFHERYLSLKSKIYVCKKLHWRTIPSTCFSFITAPNIVKNDTGIFKIFYDMWAFRILRNIKGRQILSALPGQSTHCMSEYLSPAVDWEKISYNR
jgi:hypothetical protein